jgi:hypothetical protein
MLTVVSTNERAKASTFYDFGVLKQEQAVGFYAAREKARVLKKKSRAQLGGERGGQRLK